VADVERQLLSKIIYSGKLADVLQARITTAFFHDEAMAIVWEWMEDHYSKYQTSPGRDALHLQFGNWDFVKVPEPLDYYVDALRSAHKRASTNALLREVVEAHGDGDTDRALALMAGGVEGIAADAAVTEDVDITQTWSDRMDYYEELENLSGELVGITTGFPSIDRVTSGFQGEQLIVLVAPAKAGKSTMVMKMAQAAQASFKSVLFFSFEMSNREQTARHDAMLGGFSYNKILWGGMSPGEKDRLRKALRQRESYPPFVLVHDMTSTTTLSSVAAKVAQYQPDLVIVDGVYMMDSEIPGVEAIDTRSLTKISRGLKRLAQRTKIPIIGTTQALDSKWNKKTGLVSSATGYTSAFAQDCDLMLGLEPADDDGIAKLRILDGRNAKKMLTHIKFDWEKGDMSEIEIEGVLDGDDDGDMPPSARNLAARHNQAVAS
jgi:replicative DNA helicase